MQFEKATRKKARLRLAVSGPAGSGKTTAALLVASGLGGKIALIDTERGSASLYADLVDFDTLTLDPPYAPERFIGAIHAAEKAGYDVCIIDSASHEWNGSGGCCDINEALAQARYRGNTWSAWSETTPRHRAFLDAMVQSPMHIIATMRSKTETVQGEDKKVRKIGMKAEQREGFEYEVTVAFELDHQTHLAVATKDRTRMFADPRPLTKDTGEALLRWLESGESPRLSDKELADHRAAIEAAADGEALRNAFGVAYTAAKKIMDRAAMESLQQAYDARKAKVAA